MPSDAAVIKNKIQHWKSCFSTIVNGRSKMVHVSFKHAPPMFGFVDYFVSINSEFTKQNVRLIETNMTSLNFTDLDYGTYNVVIFPSDPNNRCDGPCSRRKSDVFTIGKNTTHLLNLTVCGNTRTQVVTPLDKISKATTTATANAWKCYFLLLPLLFVLIAFILYKWKRSSTNVNELNISNLTSSTSAATTTTTTTTTAAATTTTTTTTSSGKVKVFVLYTEDHSFHTEACLSFIRYLNEHCFCDVLNTYPEYSSVPAYNMDKYSDFVLVINSQGFHKGFCAWKCSSSDVIAKSQTCLELYEKILRNSNHSLSSGICEYLMCAMDYTDNRFIPIEFRRFALFRIINDMTALVCHMQNLNLSSINENDIPRVLEHVHLSPDGNALITAIENAENFEMTHPNWFQKN